MSEPSLTTTQLVAAATKFLCDGGYKQVPVKIVDSFGLSGARIFEDDYGIAAVVVFDAWEELLTTWPDFQAGLVALMSKFVSSLDAKAWEGYLVLLTPSGFGDEAQNQAMKIRYDMTRVRKLVGVGEELGTFSDLERVLRPLLPLNPQALGSETVSALDLLPNLLMSKDLSDEAIRSAVGAFKDQKSIIETLHKLDVGE